MFEGQQSGAVKLHFVRSIRGLISEFLVIGSSSPRTYVISQVFLFSNVLDFLFCLAKLQHYFR